LLNTIIYTNFAPTSELPKFTDCTEHDKTYIKSLYIYLPVIVLLFICVLSFYVCLKNMF